MAGIYLGAQTTTPSSPALGENLFYFKADGMMYMLNSAGVETRIIVAPGALNTAAAIDACSNYLNFGGN